MIALLDGIDADPADQRGDELVDLCRLQPELCTPAGAEVLLELAATHPTENLFEALGYLDQQRRLQRDEALAAALQALEQFPVVHAARLVVELQEGLTAGAIRPALRSILYVAAPAEMVPGRKPTGDPAVLRVAAHHDLPALLDELCETIGSEQEYARRVGAGAAQCLIEFEPSVASVLVRPLIDALGLPDSMSGYWGSPRDEILDALHAALCGDPDGTAAVLEERGRRGDDDLRSALFDVYEMVIRQGHRSGEIPEAAAAASLTAAFDRLDGDWGEHIAGEAARLIATAAKWQPQLMGTRVDQLFGALVVHVGRAGDEGHSAVPTGAPPWLAAMEQLNRRNAHAALVRDLRQALGHLVSTAPEAVARNVMSVIDAPELDSEEAKSLRDEAVGLLGDLGQRAELLSEVLPGLWSSLVHSDQRVRARAVAAWQQIAARGHTLPSELDELLPALLADRYVIVHTATIRALHNGLPIADKQLAEIVGLLLGWAHTYASKEADLLDDILQILWSLAAQLPDEAGLGLREQCLRLAEYLDAYDKERFVEWRARGSEGLASFPARLLEVVADRRIDRTSQRDDGPLRQLRELDGARLAQLAQDIRAAARAHLPDDPWEAQRFVEILQRAGDWGLAIELAQEIRDGIPDDQEHAIPRAGAEALLELARAEGLLRGRQSGAALAALDRAEQAVRAQQTEIDRLPSPWESG